eukprot:5948919-Pyramimonas_sp.AAC.1
MGTARAPGWRSRGNFEPYLSTSTKRSAYSKKALATSTTSSSRSPRRNAQYYDTKDNVAKLFYGNKKRL